MKPHYAFGKTFEEWITQSVNVFCDDVSMTWLRLSRIILSTTVTTQALTNQCGLLLCHQQLVSQ